MKKNIYKSYFPETIRRSTAFDEYDICGRLDAKAHRDTIAWIRSLNLERSAESFLRHCEESLDEAGMLTRNMQEALEKLTDKIIVHLQKSKQK